MNNTLREKLGRRVREVWIKWAERQPNPKPSWLVPWEDLDDAQREVDMNIGAAIWGDCVAYHSEAIASRIVADLIEGHRMTTKPNTDAIPDTLEGGE